MCLHFSVKIESSFKNVKLGSDSFDQVLEQRSVIFNSEEMLQKRNLSCIPNATYPPFFSNNLFTPGSAAYLFNRSNLNNTPVCGLTSQTTLAKLQTYDSWSSAMPSPSFSPNFFFNSQFNAYQAAILSNLMKSQSCLFHTQPNDLFPSLSINYDLIAQRQTVDFSPRQNRIKPLFLNHKRKENFGTGHSVYSTKINSSKWFRWKVFCVRIHF